MRREEPVQRRHAERIGAHRRQAGMLETARAAGGIASERTLQCRELRQQRRLMSRCKDECGLLVDARQFQHGRWRWPTLSQRCDTSLGGSAHPALEPTVDEPPGLVRQRERRASRRALRQLTDRPWETGDVAEKDEAWLLAGPIHLDVAAPGRGALEPTRDARIDAQVLELVE